MNDDIVTNVKIFELPAPVNKILEFEKENLKFKIIITDQVLIPNSICDTYELNVYGNLCKVIAEITNGNTTSSRRLRTESKFYEKKEVLEHWQEEVNNIIKFAFENFESLANPITKLPTKVTV